MAYVPYAMLFLVVLITLDQLLKLYKKILLQELINSNQHNQHMIRLGGVPPHLTRFEPDPGTDTPKDFVRIYLRDRELVPTRCACICELS
jgi:hypothetical protein